MTCFFKALGYGLTLSPAIILLLSLVDKDWSSASHFVMAQDANAIVSESSTSFSLAPFRAHIHAVSSDKDILNEHGYHWCQHTSPLLSAHAQTVLCRYLMSVRALLSLSLIFGFITFLAYVMISWQSLKTPWLASTARSLSASMAVEGLCSFIAALLWWSLVNVYRKHLSAALGPNFGPLEIPLRKGWGQCLFSSILSLVGTLGFIIMSRRSTAAKAKTATIAQKRAEFDRKEAEEAALRREEEELKAEVNV